MNTQTTPQTFFLASLILALIALTPLRAQSAEHGMMMDGKKMASCQEMMDQKKKLAEEITAQDAKLTEQLGLLNNATDDKKMTQMAAVINLMAEQRIAMDAKKAEMDEKMMQHMQMMGKDHMAKCPMGDMKDTKTKK